jgi:carboxypeptidase C (cathepsin A)
MPDPAPAKEIKPEEDPVPTKPSVTQHAVNARGGRLRYEATADWIVLRKKGRPLAKVFHVAYCRKDGKARAERPVTFVFNGGPGAASAYLHMGAVGPRRLAFGRMGSLPPSPVRIVDNEETWLSFSDLVFIDPVGTGFSRSLDRARRNTEEKPAGPGEEHADDRENPEFWEVERDLESLGEFIQAFLSRHTRWASPVFLAGESYGGFRVAKMARKLQERYGVGLNGAILISPAIEFSGLFGTDYEMTRWIELMPSQAAVAHFHGKCRAVAPGTPLARVLSDAEDFATTRLLPWLARGDALKPEAIAKLADRMSRLIGIPSGILALAGGRIDTDRFCRLLLRGERRLVGRYDGSVTAVDPYPDRDAYEGPDATLSSIDRLFTSSINQHLRQTLGVDTELDYRLLNWEVNEAWKLSKDGKGFIQALKAMDDLRYGMSLNAHMKVFIAHGTFDLVTPYYATNRLAGLMKLTASQKRNLLIRHFRGGHMFYSWDESRRAFRDAMRKFYRSAGGG